MHFIELIQLDDSVLWIFFFPKKKKTLDFRVDTGFITLWVQAQPPNPFAICYP